MRTFVVLICSLALFSVVYGAQKQENKPQPKKQAQSAHHATQPAGHPAGGIGAKKMTTAPSGGQKPKTAQTSTAAYHGQKGKKNQTSTPVYHEQKAKAAQTSNAAYQTQKAKKNQTQAERRTAKAANERQAAKAANVEPSEGSRQTEPGEDYDCCGPERSEREVRPGQAT